MPPPVAPTRRSSESLLARSEGNPLYAEELLAAEQRRGARRLTTCCWPGSTPSAGHAELLRLASVNGTRLDTDLLVEVSGTRPGRRGGLPAGGARRQRAARSDRRASTSGTACCARRSTTTCSLASGPGPTDGSLRPWSDDSRPVPELGPDLARVAFHWDAARDQPRAFAAAVKAGLALRRLGQNEAMTFLERAIDLWDRVAEPEELSGVAKADVLRHLALGAKISDGDEVRSIRFMREALHLVDDAADPLLASRVYAAYGELCHEVDDAIGQLDAVSKALAYAEGPPTRELAGALLAMGDCEWRRQRPGVGLEYFDRSRSVARQAGLLDQEAEALFPSGFAAFELGRCSEGIQRLETLNRLQRRRASSGSRCTRCRIAPTCCWPRVTSREPSRRRQKVAPVPRPWACRTRPP